MPQGTKGLSPQSVRMGNSVKVKREALFITRGLGFSYSIPVPQLNSDTHSRLLLKGTTFKVPLLPTELSLKFGFVVLSGWPLSLQVREALIGGVGWVEGKDSDNTLAPNTICLSQAT